MNRFLVTLKTGERLDVFTDKNAIGLWVWSTKQLGSRVLAFDNICILSSEIACMQRVDENGEVSV